MIRTVATTASGLGGDAEYERLAAEAEELIQLQRSMLEDPESVDFPKYLARLQAHVEALQTYMARQPRTTTPP